MKPKGCGQAHFVQTIKGALLVKVLSRDSPGEPALRFKHIKAIYESEDAEKVNDTSRLEQQKGIFTSLSFDLDKVKIEMPFQSMDIKTVKRSLQYESNEEDGKTDNAADDDALGSLTLKEIKKRSKKKKRKLSELSDIVKQENETSSLGCIFSSKHDGTVQLMENVEVGELFSCLKFNPSKKPRTKRKSFAIGICTSSNTSTHRDTPTEQNLSCQITSQNTVDRHEPLSHSIETFDAVDLDPKNLVHDTDSSSASYVKMSCGRECIDEMPGGVNQSVSEVCEPLSVGKEVLNFVANEASKGCLMPEGSSILSSTAASSVVSTKVSSPEIQKSLLSVASECLEETSTTHSVLDFSPAAIDDLDSEKNPCLKQCSLSNHLENDTLIGISDKTSLECKVLHFGGDRSVPGIDDDINNKEDAFDTKSNDVNNKFLSYIPDLITTNTHQVMKFSNGSGNCDINTENERDSKDATPDLGPTFTNSSNTLSISTPDLDQCCSPHISSALQNDASHTTEKKHSSPTTTGSMLGCVDAALNGSSGNQSDARSVLKRALEGCLSPTKEYSPKRLFTTRKVISPTSQEKLCRDLNGRESQDSMQVFKCREKLSFEKPTECENSLVKTGAEEGDVSMIKQNIKKLTNNNNISPKSVPRGILKAPSFSCSSPNIGTECASVSSCAQKAIEFSQRQMHDMESLAIKLMKELKSMKDIAEETLSPEVCQSASSKYTADQIKSAIEDVAKAEDTTKKWLSIMSRDCLRFCKIMKSNEKKSSPASVSGCEGQKKKKNITFADKVGGALCHVKVYEKFKDVPVVSESAQREHEPNTCQAE